jgi:beta-glucanase (GH16 family)
MGDQRWKSFISGTITPKGEHEVYQYNNCQIDTTDNTMHLVAYYDSATIHQNHYHLPKYMLPEYGGNGYPPNDSLFFFSGALEYYKQQYVLNNNENERKFLYGYFEIKCKLPQHPGTFPAFWLQDSNKGTNDPHYEEIDIFEHTRNLLHTYCNPTPPPIRDSSRVFTTGIYYNNTGNKANHTDESFARNCPVVPHTTTDLSDWHVFSCEWQPGSVTWFFDGSVVNQSSPTDSIPHRPMYLKVNYAIDDFACPLNKPIWFGSDTMVIDYIKVYQLDWDCSTDEEITCQDELDNFNYSVKKTINISSTAENVVIESGEKTTFRVSDTFEITGPFQVNSGAEFTVIKQNCP